MYKGYAARDDKGEVLEITDDGGHICKCAFRVDMPEQSECVCGTVVLENGGTGYFDHSSGYCVFGIRKRRQR